MIECPTLSPPPWVELCLNHVSLSGVDEGISWGQNSWACSKIFIQQPVCARKHWPWKQLFLLTLSELGTELFGHNFSPVGRFHAPGMNRAESSAGI